MCDKENGMLHNFKQHFKYCWGQKDYFPCTRCTWLGDDSIKRKNHVKDHKNMIKKDDIKALRWSANRPR